MKHSQVIFIACVLAGCAFAQLPLPKDGCKNFCKDDGKVFTNDSVGIWYLTHAVQFGFSAGSRCTYLNVTEGSDGKFKFTNYETLPDGQLRMTDGIFGGGSSIAEYSSLKLPFHAEIFQVRPDIFLAVFCEECGLYSKEGAGVYAYLYSKILYTPCGIVDATLNLASACGIKLSDLKEVEHSNCHRIC